MSCKEDSINLLKETNAGIQMGASTLEEIISDISNQKLRTVIHNAKAEHDDLGDEAHKLLLEYGADTKEPHLAAKAMSWMKTNVKMTTQPSDQTAAELVTDGCNMGVKTLNKYINEYSKADSTTVNLAKRVIRSEEKLCDNVKEFL
ncbi:MAG: hypothetical protein LUE12_09585 [Ruminococcus sp.]|nr:hypothetical protein [Ruminococcus sp.]